MLVWYGEKIRVTGYRFHPLALLMAEFVTESGRHKSAPLSLIKMNSQEKKQVIETAKKIKEIEDTNRRLRKVVNTGKLMRNEQKAYFRTRHPNKLKLSKELENEFDNMIVNLDAPGLFDA